jgi:hypothetical protein
MDSGNKRRNDKSLVRSLHDGYRTFRAAAARTAAS